MIFICTRCKALVDIKPVNTEAKYILERYGGIDPIINSAIEYRCACREPLQVFDDAAATEIIIEYILDQTLKTKYKQ